MPCCLSFPAPATSLNSPPRHHTPMPMPMPMPRARPPALELPQAAEDDVGVDMLFDADRKLGLAGSASPRPCIVPGNALHLIDDDPAAPRSHTPPSIIILEHGPDSDASGDGGGDGDGGGQEGLPQRPNGPRVRFRSRVRITSGVHRHRHSAAANGTPTPCSSASDSPSSSISAPLRYQADENGAWGPLGKRLSAYAAGGGWPRRTQVSQPQRIQVETGGPVVVGRRPGRKAGRYSERTPLIRPGHHPRTYTEEEEDEDVEVAEDELTPEERALRATALRREEEAVFGRWPWRIFNRHWWWWHVEPIICCCCSEDSDYDEF
ncbi:hypothetical protein BD413DRAFT_604700 [Trametes elegans]|nr:hypothetical protein BD413DRAFT_604700 [Trametes elegans]